MQKMMGLLRRCVEDYDMIADGDKIAVGVSGGKDSLVLLVLLAGLRKYFNKPFELEAITIDMGFEGTDFSPIDENGTADVDHLYTKAYLRHLFKANEILAMQIASIHNLSFYLWLVTEARKHIIEGDFAQWKNMMVPRLGNRL